MASYVFKGLDHVNVTAPEELIEEVLEWYWGRLGLERIEKPPGTHTGGGWFRVGAQEVHVSIDPHNPPHGSHFGLVVDDLQSVVDSLRAAGCHLEQASPLPGRRRFYTRDPAGNRIEITSFDEPAGGAF